MLHERLLRELSADDLSGFAGEALTVWGNEVDFKHFLPRIMEITVNAGGSDWRRQDWIDWPDTESIFSRLAYGNWHEWPEVEQQAVARFLSAFWKTSLNCYPARDDIGSMITAIARTDADIEPFLDDWLELPGEAPLQHLSEFADRHASLLMARHRVSNAFWGVKQRRAADTIRSWLSTGRPRRRLVDGFFDASDRVIEEALSDAVRVLEALEALPQAKSS